jgi:hypothetical protein
MNPRVSSIPASQSTGNWRAPATRVFTAKANTTATPSVVAAAQTFRGNVITGYVSKLNGEHNVYLNTSAPRTGWFEFKWKESSGKEHLSYIQAQDLWKGSNVIGFTTDLASLARNEYKSLEGKTISDPVDLSKVVALDISYIGKDGKAQYYGTLDMKKYDKVNYGVESVSMSSDASYLTNAEVSSLYADNGMISGTTTVDGLMAPAVVNTVSGNRVTGLANTFRDEQRRDQELLNYSNRWLPNANEFYAMNHGGWQDESGAWHLAGELY